MSTPIYRSWFRVRAAVRRRAFVCLSCGSRAVAVGTPGQYVVASVVSVRCPGCGSEGVAVLRRLGACPQTPLFASPHQANTCIAKGGPHENVSPMVTYRPRYANYI